MNYPTHLSAPSDFIIAQLSDLHLSNHDKTSFDKFLSVLDLATAHKPNLLLLTGDLVNDGKSEIYDWLFDVLKNTHIPFLCLAGNHDVTQEIGHGLPFEERTFLPIPADERLIKNHRLLIELPHTTWQILAVNSAVGGQIYGRFDDESLDFLKTHLTPHHPTLIALHHHPLPVGSAWIDEYRLCNGDEFWQTLTHAPRPPHIICGHVHQAHILPHAHGTLYTCPATSRQFTPHQDEFGVDTLAGGFRLVRLHDNGELATQIHRLC